MQFIQAKSSMNKLEVLDNLPYAIDRIEILESGIGLYLTDSFGQDKYVCYRDIEELKKEWNIVNSYCDLEAYKEYAVTGGGYCD